MSFWNDKKVIVTGGAGFLGSYIIERLKKLSPKQIFVPRFEEYDLTREKNIKNLYERIRPDIVIHLAAKVGGIGANRAKPGEFFYDNLIMSTQKPEQAEAADPNQRLSELDPSGNLALAFKELESAIKQVDPQQGNGVVDQITIRSLQMNFLLARTLVESTCANLSINTTARLYTIFAAQLKILKDSHESELEALRNGQSGDGEEVD